MSEEFLNSWCNKCGKYTFHEDGFCEECIKKEMRDDKFGGDLCISLSGVTISSDQPSPAETIKRTYSLGDSEVEGGTE